MKSAVCHTIVVGALSAAAATRTHWKTMLREYLVIVEPLRDIQRLLRRWKRAYWWPRRTMRCCRRSSSPASHMALQDNSYVDASSRLTPTTAFRLDPDADKRLPSLGSWR